VRPCRATLVGPVLLLALFLAGPAGAVNFPPPQGAVNDFAKVIPADARGRMESLAREVLQKTGAALVVATFSTTGGQDIESFANELYSAWGIGQKGQDKGVLFLIALKERRFRIETGYGVEGVLPDGLLGRIRDQYILPYFKQGQYGAGFENGLAAVSAVLAKDAGVKLTGAPQAKAAKSKGGSASGIISPVMLLFIIFLILARLRSIRRRGGVLPWLVAGSMMGGRGHSSGGFGGFSGGFGGFGGGSSGGGGVSGSF